MGSKIKSKYKIKAFLLTALILFFVICSEDLPLDLGRDLNRLNKSVGDNLFEIFKIVYYVPNMIIPIFAGFIIDYIGSTYVLLVACLIGIVGQLYMLLYISNDNYSFEYLFVGRILHSVSCETIYVTVFSFISLWFQGLKIGIYFGILIGLTGIESLLLTFISTNIFNSKENEKIGDNKDLRMRYIWLFGFNLFQAGLITILSTCVFKLDRLAEAEDKKVPLLKQHPDNLLGFWKVLKRSLRQNFFLICVAFALTFCTFNSIKKNLQLILTIILWGNQSYCYGSEISTIKSLIHVIHNLSAILTVVSDVIVMIVPFFIGKYCIQRKRRYITALFGSFLMFISSGLLLSIFSHNCSDSSLKIVFFVFSLIFCSIGYSMQYVLLYSTVALMTQENLNGMRFGIIQALNNLMYFIFVSMDFKNTDAGVTMTDKLNEQVEHFINDYWQNTVMLILQMAIYIFIIWRLETNKIKKNTDAGTINLDELSSFVKNKE